MDFAGTPTQERAHRGAITVDHQRLVLIADDDARAFFRGLFIAVPVSLALWAGIFMLVRLLVGI